LSQACLYSAYGDDLNTGTLADVARGPADVAGLLADVARGPADVAGLLADVASASWSQANIYTMQKHLVPVSMRF